MAENDTADEVHGTLISNGDSEQLVLADAEDWANEATAMIVCHEGYVALEDWR